MLFLGSDWGKPSEWTLGVPISPVSADLSLALHIRPFLNTMLSVIPG